MLIGDVFWQNVIPEDKAFLISQGQKDGELEEVSKFLDDRQRHLPKTTVSAIQPTPPSENPNVPEDRRYIQLEEKVDRLTNLMETLTATHAPAVQNVTAAPRRSQPPRRSSNIRGSQPYQMRTQIDRGQRRPQARRRCQICGLFNHTAQQCRRPQHFKCNRCGQPGHLSYVCPKN